MMFRSLFISTCALALSAIVVLVARPELVSGYAVKVPFLNSSHLGGTDDVAATAPVLTVRGACIDKQQRGSEGCATIITREQFDRLRAALNPFELKEMPGARRKLAEQYIEQLAYAEAARKAGLEQDPRFQQLLRYARIRTLAEFYRQLQDRKFRNPSDQEIEAYYKRNQKDFEEITVIGIFIPGEGKTGGSDTQATPVQVAEDLRARLNRGEDPVQLQREAYSRLGVSGTPTTGAVPRKRNSFLPQEAQELFSLSPGDVSAVENEGPNYAIYKLIAKQTLPLDKVRGEISRILWNQKTEDEGKKDQGAVKVEMNEKYFSENE